MYTWCETRLGPLVQVQPLFVFFNEGAHFGLSHFDGCLHHVVFDKTVLKKRNHKKVMLHLWK